MAGQRLKKLVYRVTLLQSTEGGVVTPITLYKNKKKKARNKNPDRCTPSPCRGRKC